MLTKFECPHASIVNYYFLLSIATATVCSVHHLLLLMSSIITTFEHTKRFDFNLINIHFSSILKLFLFQSTLLAGGVSPTLTKLSNLRHPWTNAGHVSISSSKTSGNLPNASPRPRKSRSQKTSNSKNQKIMKNLKCCRMDVQPLIYQVRQRHLGPI